MSLGADKLTPEEQAYTTLAKLLQDTEKKEVRLGLVGLVGLGLLGLAGYLIVTTKGQR
jgi:hypothetical protein